MFNHIKLEEICNINGLDYDVLLQNKYDGFAKLWIDKSTMSIIAFNQKKNDDVIISELFAEQLLKIKPIELPKKEMDLDSILEKISKYGIESLSDKEKSFLDNLKNS
jgi:hypothetical protein